MEQIFLAMKKMKTSFLDNYKKKFSDMSENRLIDSKRANYLLEQAAYYAFDLTSKHGIVKINQAITDAATKYNINEDVLREKINNDSFILTERKKT